MPVALPDMSLARRRGPVLQASVQAPAAQEVGIASAIGLSIGGSTARGQKTGGSITSMLEIGFVIADMLVGFSTFTAIARLANTEAGSNAKPATTPMARAERAFTATAS